MKILITEDDLMTGKVIEETLLRNGFDVYTAPGAKEALHQMKKRPFDIILIDIHMPDIDGLSLVEHIRTELNDSTPIAIITRDNGQETIQKAFEAGADDFILKPFNDKDLIRRINRLSLKKKPV